MMNSPSLSFDYSHDRCLYIQPRCAFYVVTLPVVHLYCIDQDLAVCVVPGPSHLMLRPLRKPFSVSGLADILLRLYVVKCCQQIMTPVVP